MLDAGNLGSYAVTSHSAHVLAFIKPHSFFFSVKVRRPITFYEKPDQGDAE